MSVQVTGLGMSTETSISSTSSEETVLSIARLTMGSTLLKAGRSGRPHYRRFELSTDLTRICWESPRKGGDGACVYIKNIKKLVRGQETPVFKATPVPGYEAFSFSVLYNLPGLGERSLDVVCTERAECDTWIVSLEALMNGFSDIEAVSACQGTVQTKSKTVRSAKKGLEIEFGALGGARVTRQDDSCDVYTWGRGWRGMLGHGEESDEFEPKILDPLLTKDIIQLALSRTFSLALSTQGEVFSWGSGKYGRLGHGNLRDRFLPLMIGFPLRGMDVTYISCGEFHAAVVLDSGEVFTWGRSGSRLGYICEEGRQTHPRPVEALVRRKLKVTMSACGQEHTVVVVETGEVYSFGDNEYGQLGAGTEPGGVPPKLTEDEVAVCKVSSDIVAVKVVTGAFHSLLMSENGALASWGRGDGGQLGHGDTIHLGSARTIDYFTSLDPVRDVACGDGHTLVLTESGRIFYCGVKLGVPGEQDYPDLLDHQTVSPSRVANSSFKQLGLSNVVYTGIKQVSSGSNFAAALTESKRVLTWGQNINGQLGHKDTHNRSKPTVLESLSDKAVETLYCGGSHMACTVLHSWVPDKEANHCMLCNAVFTMVRRRHHCRKCGGIYCGNCTSQKFPLLDLGFSSPVRVCDRCYKKLNDDVINA